MDTKLTLIILLLGFLSACGGTNASRDYSQQQKNIRLIKDDALNIDHIKPVKIEVSANKSWQNTGIFIEAGDTITVSATGSWSPAPLLAAWSGPEGNVLWTGEVPGITGGALMAKLSHKGYPFEIGLTKSFQSSDYGMLYLAMNDPFRYQFDNAGKVTASIYLPHIKGRRDGPDQRALKIIAYSYNDATGEGRLSAYTGDNAFHTRKRLIYKIGEIASTKNIAIEAGNNAQKINKGGNYELLGEETENGVIEIKFRTLW